MEYEWLRIIFRETVTLNVEPTYISAV